LSHNISGSRWDINVIPTATPNIIDHGFVLNDLMGSSSNPGLGEFIAQYFFGMANQIHIILSLCAEHLNTSQHPNNSCLTHHFMNIH
jgi:hypothetical protein